MTELQSLLFAVCREPADDTPRLVVADWYEEHGDDLYARFIREQIAAAREPACRPACASDDCAACARSRWIDRTNHSPVAIAWRCLPPGMVSACLVARGFAWRGLPPGMVSAGSVARGFAFSWGGTIEQYLAHRAAIFARYPITGVWLSERHPTQTPAGERWYREGPTQLAQCAALPADLFDALEHGELRTEAGEVCRLYPYPYPSLAVESARNDLHAAAVTVARRALGLPPLRPGNFA